MSPLRPNDYLDGEAEAARPRRGRGAASQRPARKKANDHVVIDEIVTYADDDTHNLVAGSVFQPSLQASHHERQWLLIYLGYFYDDLQITDVLSRVKGGKEANVYCCAGHPATGLSLIAAKVYRPRAFRQLRNDLRYRQGRTLLDAAGKAIHRGGMLNAVRKKSAKGQVAAHVSWVEHEYQSLLALWQAGADVPQPVSRANSTILMEYLGSVETPAPLLQEVALERSEARDLFDRLLHNVELMLAQGRIHGDLSAYNVLYWEGEVKLIDFPQAVEARSNPEAQAILLRDVTRLCQFFARYRVAADPAAITRDLWQRYGPPELDPEALAFDLADAAEQ